MKKTNILIIFITFCLLAACTPDVEHPDTSEPSYNGGLDDNDKKPFTTKQVPVTNGLNGSTVTLRFYEDMGDVAYISVSDYHKMMTGSGVSVKKTNYGNYALASRTGTATVNTKTETFISEDYLAFTNMMETVQSGMINTYLDGFPYCRFKSAVVSPQTCTLTLNYGDYHIDLRGDDEAVYFPLVTINDLYSDLKYNHACYNGEKIIIVRDPFLLLPTDYDEDFYKPISKETRSEEMADFSYNNLCFSLEHYYGYPGREVLGSSMKEKGLDAALVSLGDKGSRIKQLLSSPSMAEYLIGLYYLDVYLYDGGHTSLYPFTYFDNNDVIEQCRTVIANVRTEFPELDEPEAIKYDNKDNIYRAYLWNKQLRAEKYGNTETYQKYGETAICIFDTFEPSADDYKAWKDYYSGGTKPTMHTNPTDFAVVFLDALAKASADPDIKNFVIDITLNFGGSADNVMLLTSLIMNKAEISYKNTLTGQVITAYYDVDRNLDGKFDEEDEKVTYNFNFAVLESELCFSCANFFPSLMKDNGYLLIGAVSDGGACCIQEMNTAEGIFYRISSHRFHVINKNGESIDSGIVPDILIPKKETKNEDNISVSDFSDYYDGAKINEIMTNRYGN